MSRSLFSHGTRLERIVSEVRKDCEFIEPASMNFNGSNRFNFSEAPSKGNTRNAKCDMGHFYESFAIALYGGMYFLDIPQEFKTQLDLGETIRPDIVYLDDSDISGLAEVKSCRNGAKLNLLDSQQGKYKRLDNLDIQFLFFKHRFPKRIMF